MNWAKVALAGSCAAAVVAGCAALVRVNADRVASRRGYGSARPHVPVPPLDTREPRRSAEADAIQETMPLELGVGDDRTLEIPLLPSRAIKARAGTRVYLLRDQRPDLAPPSEPGVTWRRIKVASGPLEGLRGFVPSHLIQAAR